MKECDKRNSHINRKFYLSKWKIVLTNSVEENRKHKFCRIKFPSKYCSLRGKETNEFAVCAFRNWNKLQATTVSRKHTKVNEISYIQ
jgi:hypothetical protein